METKTGILQFCLPGNFVVYPQPQINLSEKFPGYRIIDRNSDDYQMEAFIYTCAILLFYTLTTGAFMVKFILQSREPWENSDTDGTPPFASAYLAHLAKLREREMHRRLVERQARQDVKLRVINHLNQISNYNTITSTVAASREDMNDDRQRISTSGDVRSGSDGLLEVRPIHGYIYQQEDRQYLTAEPRNTMAQSGGHSLLMPLWVPARWKRSGSPGNGNNNHNWKRTPSPQMSACIPRLSPKSKRRDSLEADDASVM